MDLVKLAIVYETQSAAASLNRLNAQLATTQDAQSNVTTTTKNTTGAVKAATGPLGGLTRGFVELFKATNQGSISMREMAQALRVMAKLGVVGIILAILTAGLILVKKHMDKTREAAIKFANQLRDIKRSVDDLFRVRQKTAFEREIENISDAILELDRQLSRQRMNLLERWVGGADFFSNVLNALKAAGRFFVGGEDPQTRAQRNALGVQRGRLTPEAERKNIADRSRADLAVAQTINRLLNLGKVDRLNLQLESTKKKLSDLVEAGLDPLGDEAQYLAGGVHQLERELRTAQRASSRFKSSLDIMADSLEQFVIEGTFAFQDFLNNILKMLYRDFTEDLIINLVRQAGSPRPGTAGSGGATMGAGPDTPTDVLPPNPSVMAPAGIMAPVTINVNAYDSQDTARWLNQYGGQIAAAVTHQAERSMAMRRRFQRGT